MIKSVRELENIHIYLWIFKDICWMLTFKMAGMIVAIPTFGMAVFLALTTIKVIRLFLPNLAVLCWISANVCWMAGEFYVFNFVPAALTLFICGLIVISYHFIRIIREGKPANNKALQ